MTRQETDLTKAIAKGVKDALKSTTVSVKIEQPQTLDISVMECAKIIKDHCIKCGGECNNSTCELFGEAGCMIFENVPEYWEV